jgi:hypothetical protein
MPITLPDLDTKTYQDIVDEMLASIPNYTDKWTNYNVSDPGITILEMLCWITEATLYRINKIPDASYVNFLRLLAGVCGIDDINRLLADPNLFRSHRDILEFLREIETGNEKNIIDMKAAALNFLNSRYRAVTKEDFRELAIEATESEELENITNRAKVERAIVDQSIKEEKVRIIIVSNRRDKYKALIEQVEEYLDPRRLIGTVVEVASPVYTDVGIHVKIELTSYEKLEIIRENVRTGILNYFDPLTGGSNGSGWPYGRPLIIYEVVQVVEDTNGVKRIVSVVIDNDDDLRIKAIDGLIDVSVEVEVLEEGAGNEFSK